jgi:hypothetical protein
MSVWVTRAYADNQNPSHPEHDVKRLNEEKTMTTYYKVQSAPAPTTERSRWKPLFKGMRQGDWFIVPSKDAARARASAHAHLGRGMYKSYSVSNGVCIELTKEVK